MSDIDPKDPPAKLVYTRDGRTVSSGDGWTLSEERRHLDYLRNGKHFATANGFRPICIVRLKAWK